MNKQAKNGRAIPPAYLTRKETELAEHARVVERLLRRGKPTNELINE